MREVWMTEVTPRGHAPEFRCVDTRAEAEQVVREAKVRGHAAMCWDMMRDGQVEK